MSFTAIERLREELVGEGDQEFDLNLLILRHLLAVQQVL
jgi:hypothetical protein